MLRFLISTLVLVAGVAQAADDRVVFENSRMKITMTPRTPDQMAAFYEARGFPNDMIRLIRQQCFITTIIRNKSDDVLWLELDNWHFESADGAVRRYDREYWKKRWNEMNVPLPSQSTFRWTLLPEALDFRPNEGEGGNIVLHRDSAPFEVSASFAIGKDKRGGTVKVRMENVRCAEDPKR